MNTRLQVEHTVTEMVTGLDLVDLQIRVALGEKLALDPAPRGASIQCRINAEDPGRNFLPGPGRVTRYREPAGPFIRVDAGIEQGREIPGDYDSMFAKLVAFGHDREAARTRMLRALDEFVVEGVPTTIPVHRWILESKEFRAGTHTTTWLERALADTELPASADLGSAGPTPNRPADILVEVDGRRVPVRIFDERRAPAPRAPASPDSHHGEHVHGEILAPMQGTIVKVLVAEGDEVEAGQALLVLEAMKMENHINAESGGTVNEVRVQAGDTVGTGDVLVVIA
jgi:acetyl-CoA/propionyl-CoA carboxylase biotin carboxyl carrier protein